MKLSDFGEKKLIRDYIRPLFNPKSQPEGIGNDCALVPVSDEICACISTDRVPPDLISFELGLISYRQLGQYLAVLNISDIAACGGEPSSLLLNLAFPRDFDLAHFLEILEGVKQTTDKYGMNVVGGDLSDSTEMNLVAISVGVVRRQEALLRTGARPGDKIFCSKEIGITPTAFLHYKWRGDIDQLPISGEDEQLLTRHFRAPEPMIRLGRILAKSGACSSAMDVTDGISQSFSELAESSNVAFVLDRERLPLNRRCVDVICRYGKDPIDIALGPGADFQLVGTIRSDTPILNTLENEVTIIGEVREGTGVHLSSQSGQIEQLKPMGWDYYL